MCFYGGLCPVVVSKCLKKWRISAVVGFWLKRYVNVCVYYIVFTVICGVFFIGFYNWAKFTGVFAGKYSCFYVYIKL